MMQTSNEPLDLVKKFAKELDMITTKRPDLCLKAIDRVEKLLWFLRAVHHLNEARLSVEESTLLNLLIEIIERIEPFFSLDMLSKKEQEVMNELYFGFEDRKGLYI